MGNASRREGVARVNSSAGDRCAIALGDGNVALAQPGELEVLEHPLAEFCGATQCRGHRKVL